jgi:hypothetical protein
VLLRSDIMDDFPPSIFPSNAVKTVEVMRATGAVRVHKCKIRAQVVNILILFTWSQLHESFSTFLMRMCAVRISHETSGQASNVLAFLASFLLISNFF